MTDTFKIGERVGVSTTGGELSGTVAGTYSTADECSTERIRFGYVVRLDRKHAAYLSGHDPEKDEPGPHAYVSVLCVSADGLEHDNQRS